MPPINAASALDPAIRAGFEDAYDNEWPNVKALLSDVMEFDVPIPSEQGFFAYPESPPHPQIWLRDENIPEAGFRYKKFSVSAKDFALRIGWHENDQRYDQTRTLTTQAEKSGRNFARLIWRIFWQYVLGSTNAKLMPQIPNAPDGAALYSATDGSGANRFGASGGNIINNSGQTGVAIQNDLYSALVQLQNFQDLEGEELWPPEMIKGGVTIFHGPAINKGMADAFAQKLNVTLINNTGAEATSGVVAAGAKTNVVLDAGINIRVVSTAKITGNSWYLFMNEAKEKAIFHCIPPGGNALRSVFEDFSNSDRARRTKYLARQWDQSFGVGVFLPYQTVKVN